MCVNALITVLCENQIAGEFHCVEPKVRIGYPSPEMISCSDLNVWDGSRQLYSHFQETRRPITARFGDLRSGVSEDLEFL